MISRRSFLGCLAAVSAGLCLGISGPILLERPLTGDGVTDDTAAMQRAIDHAAKTVVHLRPGLYKITSPLKIS